MTREGSHLCNRQQVSIRRLEYLTHINKLSVRFCRPNLYRPICDVKNKPGDRFSRTPCEGAVHWFKDLRIVAVRSGGHTYRPLLPDLILAVVFVEADQQTA